MPKKKYINYPNFKPNLSPKQIFKLGSFGGTYWRPITSKFFNKELKNKHKKYPEKWWNTIPENYLTNPWEKYDKNINKYNVKVGTTLEFWEDKDWIAKSHPYGWVQWYCDFYNGKRSPDDERQIKRWKNLAGPNGRFKRSLVRLIVKKKSGYNDFTVSPKIRQTLQHWGNR